MRATGTLSWKIAKLAFQKDVCSYWTSGHSSLVSHYMKSVSGLQILPNYSLSFMLLVVVGFTTSGLCLIGDLENVLRHETRMSPPSDAHPLSRSPCEILGPALHAASDRFVRPR